MRLKPGYAQALGRPEALKFMPPPDDASAAAAAPTGLAALLKDPMRLANYETPLGDGLVIAWAGLLALGGVLFLKNIIKKYDGYSIAFLVTLLFYFLLHKK